MIGFMTSGLRRTHSERRATLRAVGPRRPAFGQSPLILPEPGAQGKALLPRGDDDLRAGPGVRVDPVVLQGDAEVVADVGQRGSGEAPRLPGEPGRTLEPEVGPSHARAMT